MAQNFNFVNSLSKQGTSPIVYPLSSKEQKIPFSEILKTN